METLTHYLYPINFQIKLETELETMPLTIPDWLPDKLPNQVGFIPLYIPALIGTGKEHAQSIYPKHPYKHFKGNQNPIQRKTSAGYIQKVLL